MINKISVKKIGASQILGDVKKLAQSLPENKAKIKAYTVFGYSDGFKSGTTTHGQWFAFQGHMVAINHVTNEEFESNQCFIPEPLQTVLLRGLDDHEKIEFACSVYVIRRDDLATGYEYQVEAKREASQADPLAHMRALALGQPAPQTAIEAPSMFDAEEGETDDEETDEENIVEMKPKKAAPKKTATRK